MLVQPRPQWISKVCEPSTGRDHLGLGSVSSAQILRVLSPGINVLSFHPRYYSFYVFLLDEFWRRGRKAGEFREYYRAREIIFSVGVHLCDRPQHVGVARVVGSDKTASLARQQRSAYDTAFNYIKSALGGFGLYYRVVMAELGLIFLGGPGFLQPLDIPSEQGKKVAAGFRRAIETTLYYREYFDDDITEIPVEVILEYIRAACLCQLQQIDAPDRPALLESFTHQPVDQLAAARRASFRLFLDLASQTQGHAITQDAFRRLLYFGATEDGAKFVPSLPVVETQRQWRMYQAREYYVFALNALWYYLCEWGLDQGGDLRPVPLATLWQYVDSALGDLDGLADVLRLPRPGLNANSALNSLTGLRPGPTRCTGGRLRGGW